MSTLLCHAFPISQQYILRNFIHENQNQLDKTLAKKVYTVSSRIILRTFVLRIERTRVTPATPAPATPNPSSSGVQSTSAKKLSNAPASSNDSDTDMDSYEINPCYLLVDTDLLSSFLIDIASCKICSSNVVVTHKRFCS